MAELPAALPDAPALPWWLEDLGPGNLQQVVKKKEPERTVLYSAGALHVRLPSHTPATWTHTPTLPVHLFVLAGTW